MRIAIGSDHGGFDLKQILNEHIKSHGHELSDVGCFSKDPVDYPDIARSVCEQVSLGRMEIGIIIDGAGIGSSMAANKINGIRAAVCNDIYSAKNAKEHNNANVLTLGSMVVGSGTAKMIVDTFIDSVFQGGRHQKRVDKIMHLQSLNSQQMHDQSMTLGLDQSQLQETIQAVIKSFLEKPELKSNHVIDDKTQILTHASRKKVLTEEELRAFYKTGSTKMRVSKNTVITPLAKDFAKDNHIVIEIDQ